MDKLLDKHRFTYSGTAEQSYFSAARIWLQEINNLDSGLQNRHYGSLFAERRRFSVNASFLSALGDIAHSVDGLAQDVEKPAESGFADGDFYIFTGGGDAHASCHTVRFGKNYRSYDGGRDVLLYLHDLLPGVGFNLQRFHYFRKSAFFEFDVDDGSRDFYYLSRFHFLLLLCLAPELISVISAVIAPCLAR